MALSHQMITHKVVTIVCFIIFTACVPLGALKMAEDNADIVAGLVCQKRLSSNSSLLHMTPGTSFIAQYSVP